MSATIIVGGQWGDEAKGKIASYLTVKDNITIACRAGLGPGAGHTVCYNDKLFKLRHTPSGFINPDTKLYIGTGVLVGIEVLLDEIKNLDLGDRIGVDPRATIVEQSHIDRDRKDDHLSNLIGSTGSGHGPCLSDRALRKAKLAQDIPELEPYLINVPLELNQTLDNGGSVLVEGTNGFLLSVYYGSYPYCVGKDSTASTVAADVGLGPRRITDVVLAFKTFPTRVGEGPFPTEMSREEVERRGFLEYGTVTSRPRRVGTFDFELAKEAVLINNPSALAITFLDRIDPDCVGKPYDQLSKEARSFLDKVEDSCEVPITLIGTGPETMDIIDLRNKTS